MKTLYSFLLLTLFVVPSALLAEETNADTLRFNNKEIIKTYSDERILVNAHLYDETDLEDIKLAPETFVPCDNAVQIDLKELFSLVKYPDSARRAGIQGVVYSKCLIGRNGKILQVIIEMSDDKLLNDAAIDAVCKSQSWIPAVKNGEKVAMWISVPVEFRLNKKKK